jgi:hypothetical protein
MQRPRPAAREDYCALRLLDSPWELSSELTRQVRSHHERCCRVSSLLNSGKWGLGDRYSKKVSLAGLQARASTQKLCNCFSAVVFICWTWT